MNVKAFPACRYLTGNEYQHKLMTTEECFWTRLTMLKELKRLENSTHRREFRQDQKTIFTGTTALFNHVEVTHITENTQQLLEPCHEHESLTAEDRKIVVLSGKTNVRDKKVWRKPTQMHFDLGIHTLREFCASITIRSCISGHEHGGCHALEGIFHANG